MAINISDPSLSITICVSLTLLLAVISIGFAIYASKTKRAIPVLKEEIDYFKNIINDLDQQAKLIIKSDMELKSYQQKIENELNKLTLIKNLIISTIHVLDKEKLLGQIDATFINNLGFKRGLILSFNNLEIKVNFGFNNEEVNTIRNIFQYKKDTLKEVELLPPDSDLNTSLLYNLRTPQILTAPIKERDKIYAIFIVADLLHPPEIKKSEKETFLILCMYLSRCLDNIGLFEDLYHSKDQLEKKIKERTSELVKSLRKIEVISKLKSDFISSVSHELRTPLTSVKGFSSLLVMEKFGKLSPEVKVRLEKIDSNVNKLVDMVNMLLDISRIESGKTEVKIASSDIVKLIKEVSEFLTPQINNKKIKITATLPEEMTVLMDKNLIERVLINLINNSIKFTPEGGEITLKCNKQGGQAVVAVSDTGVGIDKGDLEKVFNEFYRTSTTAGMPGTGLGLSLVKRIIDTHKETIWVESTLGKGTTFYFTLKLG